MRSSRSAIYYIYTSLRLDVGRVPEWGAQWAANIRAGMRNGFGEERREIHSTHSRQGKLGRLRRRAVRDRVLGAVVGSVDGAVAPLPEHALQLVVLHGRLAVRAHAVLDHRARVEFASSDGAGGLITETHFHDIGKLCFAFTAFWGYLTFGQYLVIWYGNLGEETFFMRLRLIAPWKWVTVASVVHGVLRAVLRSAVARGEGQSFGDDAVRAVEPHRHVADALHRGVSVGLRTSVTVAAVRHLGDRLSDAVRRRVGLVLHAVHGRLPANARDADHVAVSRRSAGAGESGDDGAAAGARVAGFG